MVRASDESGQAAVALVASLPLLGLAVLVAAQLLAAGHTAWSAGNAARAALRAHEVGDDPERAARRALAPALRPGLRLRPRSGPGALELTIPGLARVPPASVGIGR